MNEKTRSTTLLVVAVLLAGGFGAVIGSTLGNAALSPQRAPQGAAAPGRDYEARFARIEASLEAIRSDLAASRPGRAAQSGADEPVGGGNEQLQGLLPMDLTPESADLARRVIVDAMETRFADSQEGAAAEASLAKLVEQVIVSDIPATAGPSPTAHRVECRKGMCRIAARFPTEAAAMEWADLLLPSVGGELPRTRMITVNAPDGGSELMIYAVQPGYERLVNLREPRR